MVTGKRRIRLADTTAPQPKTGTELRQRIRSQSFSDAVLVVEWLNAAKGTAAYRRVLGVRSELEELRAGMDRVSREWARSGRVIKVRDRARDIAELKILDDKLDALLKGYSFRPEMVYSFASGIWALDMVPKNQRGRQVVVHGQGFAFMPRSVRVSEPIAVLALARLAASRELYKVRLCEMCGDRWRVSERKIDRFCSQKCREEFYAKSPDYHERKAETQRRHRRNRKYAEAHGVA